MSVSCKPQDLSDGATYLRAIPVGRQLAVAIVAAAAAAGVPLDPAALSDGAKCLECSLGIGLSVPLAIAALCNATASYNPTNQEVTNFENATGIKDPTILAALDGLVNGLKNAGVFSLFDAIYPFVGGTASACSYNLINPAAYQITWSEGVTFDATGVTGDGVTGHGDTGFNPSTAPAPHFVLNSGALGVYSRSASPTDGGWFIGGSGGIGLEGSWVQRNVAGGGLVARVNDGGGAAIVAATTYHGNNIVSRTAANLKTVYAADGLTATDAGASFGITPTSLFVLAMSQGGLVASPSNANLAFAFIGAGFSGAQVAAIQTAVTTFETALGRA